MRLSAELPMLACLVVGGTGQEQPGQPTDVATATECAAELSRGPPSRISWARLLERVIDIDMEHCPNCDGGELEIIAAIPERPVIESILTHPALKPRPPPRAPPRGPVPHFAA